MEEEAPVPFKQYFPTLSMSLYFWVVIGISAVLFGLGGYFVGIRINQLPSSSQSSQQVVTQQTQPTIPNIPGDDNDVDYSSVDGFFTTDTNYYDQLVITIDSIQNGVKTNLDTDYRYITKPQAGIQYPYSFDRLDPSKSYIVTASACTTNPKTYALICAKHIKLSDCSGKVQEGACIIQGNGNQAQSSGGVNFAVTKADNPTPSPSSKK